jgi:hypothetical protein
LHRSEQNRLRRFGPAYLSTNPIATFVIVAARNPLARLWMLDQPQQRLP